MSYTADTVRISEIDVTVPSQEVKLELEKLFSQHFKYFEVSVVRPKNKNTLLAFVKFKNTKNVTEAVERYRALQLFGKTVRVAIDRSKIRHKDNGEYSTLIDEVHSLITKLTDEDDLDGSMAPRYKTRGHRRPSQTLYIGKLDQTISKQDLHGIFDKFGIVEAISLHNKNMKNIYGFVKFFNLFMAKKALKCVKEKKLLGTSAIYDFASTAVSKYLWLGGIGPWVDPILLRKKLEEFGDIERLEWPTNKNFAYIQFSNPNSATRAMEKLRGYRLGKRKLYLDYSDHTQMTSHLNYSDLYLGGDTQSEEEEEEEINYKEYDKKSAVTKYSIPFDDKHIYDDDDLHYRHHHEDNDDRYHARSRDRSPPVISHERKKYVRDPYPEFESRRHRDFDDRPILDFAEMVHTEDHYLHFMDRDDRPFRDDRPLRDDRPFRNLDEHYLEFHDDRDDRDRFYRERPAHHEEKYRHDEQAERRSKRDKEFYNRVDGIHRNKNDGGLKCTIKNDLYYSSSRGGDDDGDDGHSRLSRKRKEDPMIIDVPPASKKSSISKDNASYGTPSHYQPRTNVRDRIGYPITQEQPMVRYKKEDYSDYNEEKVESDYNVEKHDISPAYKFNFDKKFSEKTKVSPPIKASFNPLHFKASAVNVANVTENKTAKAQNTRIKYIIPTAAPAISKLSKHMDASAQANKQVTKPAVYSNKAMYLPIDALATSEEPSKKPYLGSKYPLVWQGAITLKTNCYWTDICFISGAINLVHKLMGNSSKATDERTLKITQRLRLDMPHTMEELERRINSVGRSGSCVLIASMPVALSVDPDSTPYSELPLSKLSTFLKETQFAAVVSLTSEVSNDKDQLARVDKGLLHIFPVCDISLKFLQEEAPDLVEEFKNRDELLMILIKDVENK